MKLEKRKQFIINFLYFAIILGIVILLARYALGVLTPFLIALLVSLLLKPAVAFFHDKIKLPRSIIGIIWWCSSTRWLDFCYRSSACSSSPPRSRFL